MHLSTLCTICWHLIITRLVVPTPDTKIFFAKDIFFAHRICYVCYVGLTQCSHLIYRWFLRVLQTFVSCMFRFQGVWDNATDTALLTIMASHSRGHGETSRSLKDVFRGSSDERVRSRLKKTVCMISLRRQARLPRT